MLTIEPRTSAVIARIDVMQPAGEGFGGGERSRTATIRAVAAGVELDYVIASAMSPSG
ncbi:MAG: hypothetical protein ABGY41_04200 [Candidatus Poribacteria bacterium]